MGFLNLPVLILQQQRITPLQYAGAAVRKGSSIFAEARARAARFEPEHLHFAILDERMEQPDRVRSAADARDHPVGQLADRRNDLLARLASDHGLKLTHEVGIGMRANRGTQTVVRAVRIGNPVAQRFIDRRPQRLIAARDGDDRRAKQLHATDVRRLPLHVHRSHVDGAGHAEPRTGRCRRNAVLAGARLRNDSLRAELFCEQDLTDRVVDLVRTRVREVLALQPDIRTPLLRERTSMRERGRSPDP